MKAEVEATLQSALSENDAHEDRLSKARSALAEVFPLSVTTLTEADELTTARLDQFLYRFTKMQDSLGTRFFPALYTWLEEDDRPKPFLDVLNRLEQLGVLSSVESWQYFRALRNKIAHDYPETLGQTVETFNLLFAEIDRFRNLYHLAREYYLERRSTRTL